MLEDDTRTHKDLTTLMRGDEQKTVAYMETLALLADNSQNEHTTTTTGDDKHKRRRLMDAMDAMGHACTVYDVAKNCADDGTVMGCASAIGKGTQPAQQNRRPKPLCCAAAHRSPDRMRRVQVFWRRQRVWPSATARGSASPTTTARITIHGTRSTRIRSLKCKPTAHVLLRAGRRGPIPRRSRRIAARGMRRSSSRRRGPVQLLRGGHALRGATGRW